MNELIVSNSLCNEVLYGLQWTHSQQLIVRSFVAHWDSVVCLEIEVNEASFFSFALGYSEVLLLPTFTNPADALVVHRLIGCMSVAVFDDVDRRYPLHKASADRDWNVSIFLLYGMQVSFEVNEAKVALIVQSVYCMIVLQNFGNFAGIYFVNLAKRNIKMD